MTRSKPRKPGKLRKLISVASMAVAAVAVVKELRTPANERTWNGKVGSFVPYDFRVPTLARAKERLWNPQGESFIGPRVFGVGWTLNAGKVYETVRRAVTDRAATDRTG